MLAKDEAFEVPPMCLPYLASYLQKTGFCASSGMGVSPLSALELEVWGRITRTPLAWWEADALLSASAAYVAEYHAENMMPPYSTTPPDESENAINRSWRLGLSVMATPVKRESK